MIEVRRIPADAPDALALVEAMVTAILELYPDQIDRPAPTATPEELNPPGGVYVALYDGDRAVAGGGVKRLDDDTGEIKRMYVDPAYRGQGLSRVLLSALEDAARDLGYRRVRLDTGVHQHEALSLYRSAGYFDVEDYNDNPYASFWGEKVLES